MEEEETKLIYSSAYFFSHPPSSLEVFFKHHFQAAIAEPHSLTILLSSYLTAALSSIAWKIAHINY